MVGVGATTIAVQNSTETQQRADRPHRTVILPEEAKTQDIVSLGEKIHPKSGKKVKGIAIIERISPLQAGKGAGNNSTCYGFYAQGSKWKTLEPWVFDTYNTQGLDQNTLFNLHANDISKWEDAADGRLGNRKSVDILGNGSITTLPLEIDLLSPDAVNEVYFADVQSPGAIAITVVWGIFDGPVTGRELVEWDQVYDDVHFLWSSNGDATKMDFENISTHEMGHALGLIDLYDSSCFENTMYGYATYGQTIKRTLEKGDISGINLLY